MSFKIVKKAPTAKQWMSLRESVGWATFDEAIAEKSLKLTLYCVCAIDKGELVGMARVLGDGVISFYVGNVIVRNDRQGEGIGKAIMDEIMLYLDSHAATGAIASLLAMPGKEEFYTHFGFVARPDDKQGCGMSKRY